MKMELTPRQAQTLGFRLTPAMIQHISLLQVSRTDLAAEIAGALAENPVLEEVGEVDWRALFENLRSNGRAPRGREAIEERKERGPSELEPRSLAEHLREELRLARMHDSDRRIAEEIIGDLDEHGFLSAPNAIEEIALRLELKTDHVERVLSRIRALEPAGIAARNTEGCLLIQLQRSRDPAAPLAAKIVPELFERRAMPSAEKIAAAFEVTIDEASRALELISSLDPRPARNFGGERSVFVVPDASVKKIGDRWVVMIEDSGLPRLRLSKYYVSLMSQTSGEARAYVRERLFAAKGFIRAIYQRQQTMRQVVEQIVEHQQRFFDAGVSQLRPLTMKAVARAIDRHEATVSRVSANKFLDTPQGIVPFHFFFTADVGGVSNTSIKHRIVELIDGEDRRAPHSDQALVELLCAEGVEVKRRTVAKYREAMNLGSSAERRTRK